MKTDKFGYVVSEQAKKIINLDEDFIIQSNFVRDHTKLLLASMIVKLDDNEETI